jgi:hypothetical protein
MEVSALEDIVHKWKGPVNEGITKSTLDIYFVH